MFIKRLITEIKTANEEMHKISNKISEYGICYPDFIFFDDFDSNKYKTEREIVQYILDKNEFIEINYVKKIELFGISDYILAPFNEINYDYKILDKVYGYHELICENIEALMEIGSSTINEFIEYLHSDYDRDPQFFEVIMGLEAEKGD